MHESSLPGCVDDASSVECDADLMVVVVVEAAVIGPLSVQMTRYLLTVWMIHYIHCVRKKQSLMYLFPDLITTSLETTLSRTTSGFWRWYNNVDSNDVTITSALLGGVIIFGINFLLY